MSRTQVKSGLGMLSRVAAALLVGSALSLGLASGTAKLAYADQDPVSYREAHWDEDAEEVVYEDKTCTEYTQITNEINPILPSGWYVVKGEVTVPYRLYVAGRSVQGQVNLILCDGAKLTAQEGIDVRTTGYGAKIDVLNIYGQDGDTGELVAIGKGTDGTYECIGSVSDSPNGNVNIHGGKITTRGATVDGAGIGGGYTGTAIKIFGGSVDATGGEKAPGIGGLNDYTVIVYGGTVKAQGGIGAAGI
jgi:hypothetical protein